MEDNPKYLVDFIALRQRVANVLGDADFVTNPVHIQCVVRDCSSGSTCGSVLGFLNQPANARLHYETAHKNSLVGKVMCARFRNWKAPPETLDQLTIKHNGVARKCTLDEVAQFVRQPSSLRHDFFLAPTPP